ncbi:MAG: hypothetical protein JSW70_02070 [Syntrophobacterales bacterium]|nr:MAG: hypothetical protein JSW70_02070 [Syntrophobacterales bacterium]
MLTKSIGSERIHMNADYEIKYYQNTNLKGNSSFASEIAIDPSDKIIIDDDSLVDLRQKISLVLPAAFYSRKK